MTATGCSCSHQNRLMFSCQEPELKRAIGPLRFQVRLPARWPTYLQQSSYNYSGRQNRYHDNWSMDIWMVLWTSGPTLKFIIVQKTIFLKFLFQFQWKKFHFNCGSSQKYT